MNAPATLAYLGLGSNLGDRAKNIQNAIDAMKTHTIQICAVSHLYETMPHDVAESQPNYYNAVIRIQTDLCPNELHKVTTHLEHALGRRDKGLRKPRTIDIDILLYGEKSIYSDDLKIPHPHMLTRPFVLAPLREVLTSGWPKIAPDISVLCDRLTQPLTRVQTPLTL